jgi:hypothetical protein
MSRRDAREQLINSFIIRIFKSKSGGQSRSLALIKSKHFINSSGKKWTTTMQELFDNTWAKKVPPEILKQFRLEEQEANRSTAPVEPVNRGAVPGVRIKPNKPLSLDPAKIKPKRAYNKSDNPYFKNNADYDPPRFDEPDDIDDPKYDSPIFDILIKEQHKTRKCNVCDEVFERKKGSDSFMTCPKCIKDLRDSFNDSNENFIYASQQFLEQQREEKKKILNIKQL